MTSAWSASLRFELQITGSNINVWGIKLDTVLEHADYAIAGWLNKALIGDAILTTANDGDDEARAAMIKFTGMLAGNANITIPSVSKTYLIFNGTNKPLVFTTGAGATVTVDAGDLVKIACDGANVYTPGYAGLSIKDYIAAAVIGATGSLPALTGNAGKFIYTDGTSAFWKQALTTDLGDYQDAVLGVQVALAVAL